MVRLLLVSALALATQCLHGQALGQGNGQKDRLTGSGTLHFSCVGAGSPLVILEAGAGRGASDWAKVQPTAGELTQVCSYDRHPDHC